MNGDKCETPYCRGEAFLSLLGKWICEKCWKKHCKEEDEEWFRTHPAIIEQPIEVRL